MTATAERRVPTRRISLEEGLASVPRHFASGGDVVMSHFAAALSATFPEGEDFFVRSVRHFRDAITDAELKRAVAGFIGQEAMHGREHRAFNHRLTELGYPTDRIDRATGRFLRWRERLLSPRSNLAATAACEHFTAVMAELVLSDPEARSMFGDGPVADLFVWHALEEAEHKAVAFDVYRAVGGSERMRVWTMKFIRRAFVAAIVINMVSSLVRDPEGRRPAVLGESLRRFRRSPWMSRELWDRLHDYDRPGFHPDDHDNSQLVAEWRERLFGADGTLSNRLVGRAA